MVAGLRVELADGLLSVDADRDAKSGRLVRLVSFPAAEELGDMLEEAEVDADIEYPASE